MYIDPTQAELLYTGRQYLPRNDGSRCPRSDEGPEEVVALAQRHLETHFRLLRYEMVGPLQEGLSAVLAAASKGTKDFRIRGSNTMSFVFHDAAIESCGGDVNKGLFFTVRPCNVLQ